MEENQNNQMPSQAPEAPQTPTTSMPPQTPQPQPQVTPGVTPPPNLAPQSGGKNGMLAAVISIAVIIVLIGAGLLAWFLLLSPNAQAKKASNTFMSAASKGDADELYKITEAESDSERKFLDNVARSLRGSYSLSDKTSQNGKWYFLYDLSGADSKYARTIVEKKDSKYIVSSLVHGKSALKLVPISSNNEPSVEPNEEAADTEGVACLVQEDYKWMNYNKQPSSVKYDSTLGANTFNYTATMFFEANTTKEKSFSSVYDDWAEFATKNASKQWEFILKGQINQQGQNSVDRAPEVKLANDRAEKVKSELLSRNVPSSRITIVNPTDTSPKYLKGTSNELRDGSIFQSVILTIDPTCSSAR